MPRAGPIAHPQESTERSRLGKLADLSAGKTLECEDRVFDPGQCAWAGSPYRGAVREEVTMRISNPQEFEGDWPIVNVIGAAASWWRRHANAHDAVAELARCDPGELSQIAGDLGLSSDELQRMASYGPDAAEQLHRRMAALHIKAGATDPRLMRDLERLCTTCTCKTRCNADLAHAPQAPGWKQYCPNAETLQDLSTKTVDS
jgi:hypothetical protein